MTDSRIIRTHSRAQGAARDFAFAALACFFLVAWVVQASWPAAVRQQRWQVLEAVVWAQISPRVPLLFTSRGERAGAVLARARVLDPQARPAIYFLLVIASAVGIAGGVVVATVLRGRRRQQDSHVRGARLVSAVMLRAQVLFERAIGRMRGRVPDKAPIMIGGIPVPYACEPLHFVTAGSTGVGKSQQIRGMLKTIRERGERAIVADIGGDLFSSFVERGDLLLNPLDRRSVQWSPFAEMRTSADADRIAASMIPAGEGESGEWHKYSQALVAAVLERLFMHGEATNERLLHFLTTAKSGEIEQLVAGHPASTLFDTGASKMLSSVRGIIGSYLPAYRFLNAKAGHGAFSISAWVTEVESGWLWMPYQDRDAAAVRPLLQAWLGEVVSSILSFRPDPTRRMWLILDEVASLGLIGSLSDGLTKGRKYGLCCVLGLQSISQLRTAYGREGAVTLLSCLRNSIIFAVDDADTADNMSRRLGDSEQERQDETVSDSGKSSSTRRTTSRLVLPSEIMTLPNLSAYLKLAGDYPVARVRIPVVPAREVCKPFVPRGT